MKLSISQLAFDTEDNFNILIETLKENKISNIELVLPKIIDWGNPDINVLQKYISNLNRLGFECLSTQSITYNTSLKSFCEIDFIKHIFKVSDLCKDINIKILVLGAPKLRDKYDTEILLDNFKLIDSYLKNNDQILCIEPNCSLYNGNYFTTLNEIIIFLEKGNFTNIKTMIDTHNLIYENFNPTDEFIKYEKYISHIHVSEVNLDLFKQTSTHEQLGDCLRNKKYEGVITYEVQTNINEYFITSLKNFSKIYNI